MRGSWPLSNLLRSFSSLSTSPRSCLGTYVMSSKIARVYKFKTNLSRALHSVMTTNADNWEHQLLTFPGVLVGDEPSASQPRQSRSFCLPVFNRSFLLKRTNVDPPTAISIRGWDTSQTYVHTKVACSAPTFFSKTVKSTHSKQHKKKFITPPHRQCELCILSQISNFGTNCNQLIPAEWVLYWRQSASQYIC